MRFSERVFVTCLSLTCLVGVILQAVFMARLRAENEELRGRERAARGLATQQVARELRQRDEELQILRVQNQDVFRLRNEVRHLRAITNELARLRAQLATNETIASVAAVAPSTNGPFVKVEENFVSRGKFEFAGYTTAEAALKTFLWAGSSGNLAVFLASLSPDARTKMEDEFSQENKTQSEISADLKKASETVTGYSILDQTTGDDTVTFRVQVSAAITNVQRIVVTRTTSNEWKLSDASDEK
jgi:hypothetical protein